MKSDGHLTALDVANSKLTVWLYSAYAWTAVYWIFGISATVGTVTVASKPEFIKNHIDVVAYVAAVCTALLTFLSPDSRATGYITAWRYAVRVRDCYLIKKCSEEQLIDAVDNIGEKIIARQDLGPYQPPSAPSTPAANESPASH